MGLLSARNGSFFACFCLTNVLSFGHISGSFAVQSIVGIGDDDDALCIGRQAARSFAEDRLMEI